MASQSLFTLRSPPLSNGIPVSANDSNHPTFRSSNTQDVFHLVVKSRKSWKTTKGGGIVWPPELEAALLQGLEAYQPDDSRETRLLGRFPMRNRFISDYIHRKTNLRRTAKQVGSRLQQLRDTCNDKKLMKLLSPYCPTGPTRYNNIHRSKNSWNDDSSNEAFSPPSTPVDASTNMFGGGSTFPPTNIISIDILPPNTSFSYEASLQSLDWSRSNGVLHPSSRPRPFYMIDPTVTFVAHAILSAYSLFTVYMEGSVVHSEATHLTEVGSPHDLTNGALLYTTTLVPTYWSKIAESSDPTQYIITQNVVQDSPGSQSTVFSAIYKFSYYSDTQNVLPLSTKVLPTNKPMGDVQASLNYPGAMDASPECIDRPLYYNAASFEKQNSDWASPSPSQLSGELSGHQSSEDGVDSLVSPSSTCFSVNAPYFPTHLGV